MPISPEAAEDLRRLMLQWSSQHVKVSSVREAECAGEEARRICAA